ncbi:MAG: hypothetical protein ACK5Q5_03415, partial [Planctomycetaceae bacterium]
KVIRRGDFASAADLEAKLWAFLTYFNQTQARPFEWTYTGRPQEPARRRPFAPAHHQRIRPTKVQQAQSITS